MPPSNCRQLLVYVVGWLLPVSSADPQAPVQALQSPGHPLGTARERASAAGTQHPVPACTGMLPQWLGTNIFLALWTELGSFPILLGCAVVFPHASKLKLVSLPIPLG